jgi:Metal-dependent proteases with possible chaperone activity
MVGGVASNDYIKENIIKAAKKYSCDIIFPPKYMLSDNAAMIAWACLEKKTQDIKSDIFFEPNPRLKVNTFKI